MDPLYADGTIEALTRLKDDAEILADTLVLNSQAAVKVWEQVVNTRLLPRLRPGFPLTVAICGGGSSGKSTLFNSLAGDAVSPTGGRAGINRRILIALGSVHREHAEVADALFEPFGCAPQLLEDREQLTTPGNPLLHYSAALPESLALIDTPDFDTGAGGSYHNRDLAERSLRAADVLIYIFTNANYNNRDNTDFMTGMLTAVGTRKSFLVYRAYPSFSDEEVKEHADTVAHNLYGEKAASHVLGVYRAGEDNRVAAGQRAMELVPIGREHPGLIAALTQIDPRRIKGDLHRSIFQDVVHQGRTFLEEARASRSHLALYLDGLRAVRQRSVQDALGHLPMDAVVRRFSEIWQETDPAHVKIMRTTGRVVEAPVRLLMRAVTWIGGGKTAKKAAPAEGEMAAAMEADLIRSANRLRQAAVDPAVELDLRMVDPVAGPLREAVRKLAGHAGVTERASDAGAVTLYIPLPPSLAKAQATLRDADWSSAIDDMLDRQETLLGLTSPLEAELQRLANEQRSRMTTLDQVRQTFSAMLNIIPATAAVTYVLHTGDPMGAAGIKVKLAGLFGLNDLYALVAIPATAGMKKADLKQLQALLAPVARAWLTHKLTAIEGLFEETITGTILDSGASLLDRVDDRIDAMAAGLARCEQALEKSS